MANEWIGYIRRRALGLDCADVLVQLENGMPLGVYSLSAYSRRLVGAVKAIEQAGLYQRVPACDLPRLVATLRLAGLTVEVEE